MVSKRSRQSKPKTSGDPTTPRPDETLTTPPAGPQSNHAGNGRAGRDDRLLREAVEAPGVAKIDVVVLPGPLCYRGPR
jgi:hypothetical protein